jgi:hypothetical protein
MNDVVETVRLAVDADDVEELPGSGRSLEKLNNRRSTEFFPGFECSDSG